MLSFLALVWLIAHKLYKPRKILIAILSAQIVDKSIETSLRFKGIMIC